jgi:TolA-binding protein
MALFGTRHDYAEAAQVLAESARRGGDTAIDDEFNAARAISRAGRDPDAIVRYRRFVRSHPDHAKAAEAEFLAGWLEVHLGQLARGERSLERFLAGPRAARDRERRRDATWYLAFTAFERGRFVDAARRFAEYAGLGRGGWVSGRGH